ncbi:MAG TPA: transcriptional regulator, partial [Alphaproteobacteria bacterium]|nr:transcriptional regulator [Alphaproteobacteria bacterium]
FIFERSDGRQIAMSFYLAPDDIFDDPDALISWAAGAFAAARRAAARRKPGKRRG